MIYARDVTAVVQRVGQSEQHRLRRRVFMLDRRQPVLRVIAVFRARAVRMGILGTLSQRVIREVPRLAARRRYTRQFATGRVSVIRRVAVIIRHGRNAPGRVIGIGQLFAQAVIRERAQASQRVVGILNTHRAIQPVIDPRHPRGGIIHIVRVMIRGARPEPGLRGQAGGGAVEIFNGIPGRQRLHLGKPTGGIVSV
ncbi:MAG: hypothetical protein BWX80_02213 [Candidatus Hydrogenedentes bacterium ADurb.Bin101]|nr:MAG: hypothetical protein BWX80_02213 [Candidatus Hydrogenedentes bacterium ADurb.Bin101]